MEVFHIACVFIDSNVTEDRRTDAALYTSEQNYRTLTLAAITILRICRSPEASLSIDQMLGEQSYFAAIQLLRKRILKNNDVNARMSSILSQLWQSRRVFIQDDGSFDSLHVRIRSRGVSLSSVDCRNLGWLTESYLQQMGIVYDCLWYWRQEFLDQSNPYAQAAVLAKPSMGEQGSSVPSLDQPQPTLLPNTPQLPDFGNGGLANFSDNEALFSEWNWSLHGYPSDIFSQPLAGNGMSGYI